MTDTITRPAVEGERCTCGRPAREVFVYPDGRESGYCGLPDGGRQGPCVFCGSTEEHIGRCPDYQLRAIEEKS
jgi:hypothetical protein